MTKYIDKQRFFEYQNCGARNTMEEMADGDENIRSLEKALSFTNSITFVS